MGLRDVIKDLTVQKKISVAELERTLGFGNGSISKWNRQSPSVDKLNKVADYFDVSVDYLLGRTNTRSKKDNSKVALDDNDIVMTWRGQPLSDEDREMIKRIMNGKD